MKKKMMLTVAAVAMVGTLAVGGTLAWFTDTETATNVVTTGNVDIQWFEGNPEEAIDNDNPGLNFDELNIAKVPGASFTKDAKIKNVGNNDAYIRAKIIVKVDGAEVEVNTKDDIPAGYDVEIIDQVAVENSRWVWGEDGYIYYLDRVAADQQTGNLIGEIGIATDATDAIENQKFELVLNAEAIQADHVENENTAGKEGLEFVMAVFEDKNIIDKTKNDDGTNTPVVKPEV